jgi:hypothetical protein
MHVGDGDGAIMSKFDELNNTYLRSVEYCTLCKSKFDLLTVLLRQSWGWPPDVSQGIHPEGKYLGYLALSDISQAEYVPHDWAIAIGPSGVARSTLALVLGEHHGALQFTLEINLACESHSKWVIFWDGFKCQIDDGDSSTFEPVSEAMFKRFMTQLRNLCNTPASFVSRESNLEAPPVG